MSTLVQWPGIAGRAAAPPVGGDFPYRMSKIEFTGDASGARVLTLNNPQIEADYVYARSEGSTYGVHKVRGLDIETGSVPFHNNVDESDWFAAAFPPGSDVTATGGILQTAPGLVSVGAIVNQDGQPIDGYAFQSGEGPSKAFHVGWYTGDGGASRAISGVGFTPDMVWTGLRSSAFGFRDLQYCTSRGETNMATFSGAATQPTAITLDPDGFTTTLNSAGAIYWFCCMRAVTDVCGYNLWTGTGSTANVPTDSVLSNVVVHCRNEGALAGVFRVNHIPQNTSGRYPTVRVNFGGVTNQSIGSYQVWSNSNLSNESGISYVSHWFTEQ